MKLGEFLIYERDGSVQLNRAKFVRSEKFKAALAAWRRIRQAVGKNAVHTNEVTK